MTDLSGSSILIVDDELGIRSALQVTFEFFNCVTHSATSGNKAFELLKNHQVDIVLSDIRMQDGDGIELLQKIKQSQDFDPIVVLMTGYADITEAKVLKMGGAALIHKPFDPEDLEQTMVSLLASSSKIL